MIARYEERKSTYGKVIWSCTMERVNNILHWHFENELLYVLKGEISVYIGNSTYTVKEGNSIFVRGGEVHYIRSTDNSLIWALIFDYDILDDLLSRWRLVSPIITRYDFGKFRDTYLKELKSKDKFFEISAKVELKKAFLEIFRLEEITDNFEDDKDSYAFKTVFDYIENNMKYVTFKDAVEISGYTEAYFSRKFKCCFGVSFTELLNRLRVERAIEMIKSGESKMAVIADECGFNTIRNFNIVFKKITGYSPKLLPKDFVMATDCIRASGEYFNPTSEYSLKISD